MLCCNCHQNEANVHIQEIVGGKNTSIHLCAQCAAAKGVLADDHKAVDISSVISKISEAAHSLTEDVSLPGDDDDAASPACSRCGLTGKEFRQTRRFGCPSCYVTFKPLVNALLSEIHRGTRHSGRRPEDAPLQGMPARITVGALERELARAVAAEDYEGAAELRDEIQQRMAVTESVDQ